MRASRVDPPAALPCLFHMLRVGLVCSSSIFLLYVFTNNRRREYRIPGIKFEVGCLSRSPSTALKMSAVGSLTTTFTPSPSCLTDIYKFNASSAVTVSGQLSSLVYIQLGPTSTSDCVPSSFAPSGAYYSPGICPSGYTQACKGIVTSGTVTETQATCCPRSVG
jgi:hypothetical protein